jgi:hypothetical protein
MAGAALAATPPVHVAGTPPAPNRTSELDWRVVVAFDGGELSLAVRLTGAPNYRCVTFDTGCPPGTRIIDSEGNLVGCTANCGGECTVCSGSVLPVSVCVRKPGETCMISTTTSVDCGNSGRTTCFVAAPGAPADNRGCWCAVPAVYPEKGCKTRDCIVVW